MPQAITYVHKLCHYDTTNLKNIVKFYVPTWSIFAGPVTIFHVCIDLNLENSDYNLWLLLYIRAQHCLAVSIDHLTKIKFPFQ